MIVITIATINKRRRPRHGFLSFFSPWSLASSDAILFHTRISTSRPRERIARPACPIVDIRLTVYIYFTNSFLKGVATQVLALCVFFFFYKRSILRTRLLLG